MIKINLKPKVLDLFCGAGGLSKGFKNAGFDIVGGIDFDEDSIKTHELNFKNSTSICGDLTKITGKKLKEIFKKIDVVIGGPPCQGFSSANRWQDTKNDIRNKLFMDYIRVVKLFKPKICLIENVSGILTQKDGYAKRKIYSMLEKEGYVVESAILNASDYGVPQSRRRAFFVAVKGNNNFDFDSLKKVKRINTVFDAIGDLYKLEEKVIKKEKLKINERDKFGGFIKDFNIVTNHYCQYPNEIVQSRMEYVKQGENWRSVPEHMWQTKRVNRHSSAYRRLSESEPSITIDTGHMNYFHPIFNRVPTVRESARLQSFPDSFRFAGSKTSQLKQVGNAVPPFLVMQIAKEIKKIM